MSYLIAKRMQEAGAIALEIKLGKQLVAFKKRIEEEAGDIELITISRPSAFGEYAPYYYVDTAEEFETGIRLLQNPSYPIAEIGQNEK